MSAPDKSKNSQAVSTPDAGAGSGKMVWRNGELLDSDAAGVSPFDHGLLTGDGVFETLVSRAGEAFAESRHYQRLLRSAAAMGLEVPAQEELSEAMRAVVHGNGYLKTVARVRITVTGGVSPLGSDRGQAVHTVLVAASPSPDFPPTTTVVRVPFTRNETGALRGVKSTSYGENVVALKYAKARGAGEAIFGNTRGELCEGSGTNVFVRIGDRLITPPLASGCLAGVTRGVVLDVCAREGIDVFEEAVPLADFENAQEAFLTSTLRDVQAIDAVDGGTLAGSPGPITRRVRQAFHAFVKEFLDP